MTKTKKQKPKPAGIRLDVEITAEIIAIGVARDSRHCMIADAVKASFPGALNVSVDLATIRLTDPAKRLRYTFLTPRVAQNELVRFDQGIQPEPFRFQLRNAHVTRAGTSSAKRVLTQKEKGAGDNRAQRMRDVLARTGLRTGDGTGSVAERVGGKTPPKQRDKDGIPFSRRRAFGLRALNM